MKKLLLIVAVMLVSLSAFAQHTTGTFSLQPKVGMNVANLTDIDNSDPRIGFVGGVEGEYQASDVFSFSAGILYSMQGGKDKQAGATQTYKLDYINVPILANVYVIKGLAVKVGVQPAFKVNSEYKLKYEAHSGETDMDAKSFDFSIPVGISYEYNNIVLDARYNFGLTKTFDNSDSKNSVFQITLGYKFDL